MSEQYFQAVIQLMPLNALAGGGWSGGEAAKAVLCLVTRQQLVKSHYAAEAWASKDYHFCRQALTKP